MTRSAFLLLGMGVENLAVRRVSAGVLVGALIVGIMAVLS